MDLRVRRRPDRGPDGYERAARRQGRQPCRDGAPRPAGPAGLHRHHRGLHALLCRGRTLSGRARRTGRGGAGRGRGDGRQAVRRRGGPVSGLRAVGRAGFDARHDGHGAEPRPERPDGGGAGGKFRGPALRLRQLPALRPDVRRCGARGGPRAVRGRNRSSEGREGHRGRCGPRRRRLERPCRPLQGNRAGRDRRGVSAGPAHPALGSHRGRDAKLADAARPDIPPPARHSRGVGHGGQCAGDGVRQYGRRLRHRRRLHPQSLPARTRSTANISPMPRART